VIMSITHVCSIVPVHRHMECICYYVFAVCISFPFLVFFFFLLEASMVTVLCLCCTSSHNRLSGISEPERRRAMDLLALPTLLTLLLHLRR